MKKFIYIVLDGIGRARLEALGDKTALGSALTPHMDKLAQTGRTGVLREASLEGGRVFFRAAFAMVADDGKTIKNRDVGKDLSDEEAALLAREVNEKVFLTGATFEFWRVEGGYLLVLGAMHHAFGRGVTGTDSCCGAGEGSVIGQARPWPDRAASTSAVQTAAALNEFTAKTRDVLRDHPVNLKRSGQGKDLANIVLSSYAVSGPFEFSEISRGGAGVADVVLKGEPSDADTSRSVFYHLDRCLRLYVRLRGIGALDAGQDDFNKKKAFLERADQYFFAHLLSSLKKSEALIVVTGDPAAPVLVSGVRVKPDGSMSFSEKACCEGALGEISESGLMDLLARWAKDEVIR